jgi:spore coat polysaccharide biosynthesis protein SpsF
MSKLKKIAAVIIAREGSTRLPGKAVGEVQGQPMIGHIIDRLKNCAGLDEVIIATSTNPEDDAIEKVAKQKNCKIFRGHPEDVLDRLYHAVTQLDVDAIVEVGGDCPFISPELVEEGIRLYRENPDVDFVSNTILPPYTYPDGYDFILLSKETLENLHTNAALQSQRFQPFQYLVKNAADFKYVSFTADQNYNHLRWTLDYPEDLEFVKKVYSELYPDNPYFGFSELKALLEKKPELADINSIHAHNTMHNSAWYTGSYVGEAHADIVSLLNQCLLLDKEKKYSDMVPLYSRISAIIEELDMRAKIRYTNG